MYGAYRDVGGGLTCDAAASDSEEGQLKPPAGFASPRRQDKLICVLGGDNSSNIHPIQQITY